MSVGKYPAAYIDACRRKLDVQVAAYKKLRSGPDRVAFEFEAISFS